MKKLGEWTIIGSLGEGGQGWTYRAESRNPNQPGVVVLKKLKNVSRLPRFKAEVEALNKLSHRGIVKLIDWQIEQEIPFLVMEYCEKGDLTVNDFSSLALRERLVIFPEICMAVSVAHKSSIVHRDLKPKNILVRRDNSIAVGDFGLCLHTLESDDRVTDTGEAVGPRD